MVFASPRDKVLTIILVLRNRSRVYAVVIGP